MSELKIIAISDTHNKWQSLKIPECDILISAGDYSFNGEPHVVKDFHAWLDKQEASHIISVQGNHETWVEKNWNQAKDIAIKACPAVHFIDEGLVDIEGVKIWCSAITPYFCNWAWNRHRGEEIKRHWDRIPDDTDILVTHGPAYGILDQVCFIDGTPKERVGCEDLLNRIKELKKLQVHICGHIHSSYGQEHINGISHYNASNCDEMYMVTNPITEITWI